jgi:sialic acid synthase SpsE
LEVLTDAGTPLADITVLHCTTEYPTPFQDVHLRAMLAVGAAFGVDVGYSDHTEGIEVAVAAAALGAKVIEKHFTLDRGLPGPDHSSSLEPPQLAAMVASVRNVERSLGSPVKRPTSGELETSRLVRKAIVAARPIKAGEMLTEENLTVKRPCYGISAAQWDHVVGRPARREYRVNEEIEW